MLNGVFFLLNNLFSDQKQELAWKLAWKLVSLHFLCLMFILQNHEKFRLVR